ncbi:MAG: calcium-binding protein [Kiloniellales bacterium]
MAREPHLWQSLGRVNKSQTGTSGNDQTDAQVVGLANGNMLVVYTDDTNSVDSANGTDVIGQLYGPEGKPIGDNFQLNTLRSAHDEGNAEVAALSDGGFVVVYEDVDSFGTTLIWERFDDAGAMQDRGVLQADPGGSDLVSNPQVAVFDDDSFVVTYTRTTAGNSDVRARVVSDTGTVGSEFTIRADPDDPRDAAVAVLSNGNLVSAYVEDDSGEAKLEYAIYSSAGALVRNANIVSTGSANETPQVVALETSGFAVVWSDRSDPTDGNIFGRVFNNSGTDLAGQITIQDSSADATDPTVAALKDGGFAVVYTDKDKDALIAQSFDSLGTTQGGATLIETAPPSPEASDIGVLSDGRFLAAWEAFDGGSSGFDITAEIWDPRDFSFAGTSGNDVLTARRTGSSTINGMSGDDTILGTSRFSRLYGGEGADSVFGRSGTDVIRDEDGLSNDRLDGGSGNDTVDMRRNTGLDTLVVVDLSAGFATVFGGSGDLIFGVENLLVGGEASLLGTSGNNRLSSGASADGNYIAGRSGDDTLFGYGGVDSFYGGAGQDTLSDFGNSDDRFDGGEGDDFLDLGDGDDTGHGAAANDVIVGESGADTLFGGGGGDTILGGGDEDRLYGDGGNDSLFGGNEDDLVYGDKGNDSLFGDSGSDFLQGGDGDDVAFGGRGGNDLFGGSGNDTLNATTGADRLSGGSGDDILTFTLYGSDTGEGDDGNDTIFGGTGRGFFDGGSGADLLFGDHGDDTLLLLSGVDSAFGGSGADRIFALANSLTNGDRIDGGSGSDRLDVVAATETPTLAAITNVETIAFYGTTGADSVTGLLETGLERFFGAAGDDDLRGFSGIDRFYGGEGDDAMRGFSADDSIYDRSGGKDTLFGGDGNDILEAGDGRDQMVGGSGSDILYGDESADRLNGGSGVDTAYGGVGNDTFIIDTQSDILVEVVGGGPQDVLRSGLPDYTLSNDAKIERGNVIQSAGAASFTGNNEDNTVLGNTAANQFNGGSGDDVLNGFGGSDLLIGGSGQDTFVVDTLGDLVFELADGGHDLVRALSDYTLGVGVEDLRMQGKFGNIDGTGNAQDNSLQGNTGDNALFGAEGDDSIWGRDGMDSLYGDSGADTLELENDDSAFGGSGADWMLFDGDETGNGAGSGGPLIADFQGSILNGGSGLDRLVFATGLESGSFEYRAGKALDGSGNSEARHDGKGQIQVDSDGDGSVDIVFRMGGMSAAGQLTASDFIWL